MEQRRNLENSEDNLVYLSPQSVNSRIRSINDEIKNRIKINKEENEKIYNDEDEDEIVSSKGSISVDRRLRSLDGRLRMNVNRKIPIYPEDNYLNKDKETINYLNETRSEIKSLDGRVRKLVNNYSMKINKEGIKKNPFSKIRDERGIDSVNPFTTKSKDPFSTNSTFYTNTPLPINIPRDDLSVLSINDNAFPSKPFTPITLTPINVIYAPKQPPRKERVIEPSIPKKSFNKTLTTPNSFYGPGIELTQNIAFTILNTIYIFENGKEDTIYYLRVESGISWIIRKSLSQIREFIKEGVNISSYNPYDKKIRDSVIITILNTLGERDSRISEGRGSNNSCINRFYDSSLQFFILTNISKEIDKRSTYLLMGDSNLEPFNFRLVGQALVCYDKSNRVKKLFLLKGCTVEIHSEYSFIISSLESSVILYSSCITERDSWMKDINEFIQE